MLKRLIDGKCYANMNGDKIARIMRGGKNEFYDHPNGVIKQGLLVSSNNN